jgi:hypothetical protein
MLVPGEEPEIEPTESIKMQKRLSSAVADIAKLANVLEALSVTRPYGTSTSGQSDDHDDEDGRSLPAPVARDFPNGDVGARVPRTVGSAGESTPKLADFAKMSRPTPDTSRQAASHYRM